MKIRGSEREEKAHGALVVPALEVDGELERLRARVDDVNRGVGVAAVVRLLHILSSNLLCYMKMVN